MLSKWQVFVCDSTKPSARAVSLVLRHLFGRDCVSFGASSRTGRIEHPFDRRAHVRSRAWEQEVEAVARRQFHVLCERHFDYAQSVWWCLREAMLWFVSQEGEARTLLHVIHLGVVVSTDQPKRVLRFQHSPPPPGSLHLCHRRIAVVHVSTSRRQRMTCHFRDLDRCAVKLADTVSQDEEKNKGHIRH